MSGNSNVGNSQVYQADDQRNPPQSELNTRERYEEGKENSHNQLDSKDERSIANKLAAEEKGNKEEDSFEVKQLKHDPTLPAKSHGNEPSRGAKIDAEIQAEEEAILAKKNAKK